MRRLSAHDASTPPFAAGLASIFFCLNAMRVLMMFTIDTPSKISFFTKVCMDASIRSKLVVTSKAARPTDLEDPELAED